MHPRVIIPKPCPASARALTPTEAGWHCARCQTEVIDFTRLSEAEIVAYLAERRGQRVCAVMQAPVVPQQYKRPNNVRRWLLAAAAFLGWQSAEAVPPHLSPVPPPSLRATANKERIVIRGVVLDDSLNVPIQGAFIFIKGTKYGAVSNEKGEFSFSFAPNWPPAQKDEFLLEVSAGHFIFQNQFVTVSFKEASAPAALTVRMHRFPLMTVGKARLIKPPVAPPGSRKSQP